MTEETDLNQRRRWQFNAGAANNIVQTIAIIAAGAWAVYTFIYQAKIAPAQEPPSISVTSTVAAVGHQADQVAIRSTVTRTNVGQTGVRVLALTYNVVGTKVKFADQTGLGQEPPPALSHTNRVTEVRYYEEADQEVILRHGLLFKGATQESADTEIPESVLKPGESISRDMIFFANRDTFDFIRFQVRLTYAKESDPPTPLSFQLVDEGQLTAVPVTPCPPDDDSCTSVVTTDFTTDLSLW